MQDYPGAPGTARPGNPGTAVPAACGGAAVQPQPQPQAWDHIRSCALPMPKAPDHNRFDAAPMPKASDHNRSHATPMPKAPDHTRSGAASMPKAPGHIRPGAASMASPGHADGGPASAGPSVPLTTAPLPASVSRPLQEVLPRVPATPLALTYPQSHSTTHPVHPAMQAPTRPPPATAGTGFLRQRHSRAPPQAACRIPTPVRDAARLHPCATSRPAVQPARGCANQLAARSAATLRPLPNRPAPPRRQRTVAYRAPAHRLLPQIETCCTPS